MPPKIYSSYASYYAWFKAQYDALVLPADAVECGPYMGPTLLPARPPWKLNWWIVFADGNFISCSEIFDPIKRSRDAGQLAQFSYHYGKHPGRVDKRGSPKHSTSQGTLIRIDLAPHYADHIHFAGEDHIPQQRIKGSLVVLQTTMFGFIKLVLMHRETGMPLAECFDFEVL